MNKRNRDRALRQEIFKRLTPIMQVSEIDTPKPGFPLLSLRIFTYIIEKDIELGDSDIILYEIQRSLRRYANEIDNIIRCNHDIQSADRIDQGK